MLSLARYCTTSVGRCNATRFVGIRQNLYTRAAKSSVGSNTSLLLKKCPTYLPKGLFKQNSLVALSYASKVGKKSEKIVGTWMLTCSGMVFIAVVLGTLCYILCYYCICNVLKVVLEKTYGK